MKMKGPGETPHTGFAVGSRRFVAAAAILLAACATALALGAGRSPAAQKKPNVVLLMTDDQRFDELAAMPNTRRLLKAQGTTFSNSFVTFPLCCPSRTTFMTGQMAHNHGVNGNFPPEGYHSLTLADQRNMLPAWLQNAGYRTSHIGKYLNGYGDDGVLTKPPGWTDWHGTIDQTSYDYLNTKIRDNNKTTQLGSKPWADEIMRFSGVASRQELTRFANGSDLTDPTTLVGQILLMRGFNATHGNTYGTTSRKKYLPDELSDRAVNFIRSTKNSSKPFYMQYAPPAPHREDVTEQVGYRGINPRIPTRYDGLVQGKTAPRSNPAFDEADISDKPAFFQSKFTSRLGDIPENGTFGHPSLTMLDNYYKGRYGALKAVDDGIGRIINTLKATGKLNNTLIIFTSDNGWMMGEHRITGDKFVPYEQSIRVPLIIRGPGIPKNKTVDALVANTDLTSTVLQATKINPSPGRVQDGTSLIPVAKTGLSPRTVVPIEATRDLFVLPGFPYEWDTPYFGVRTDRWKYVKWEANAEKGRSEEEELYDLLNDPNELENLAGSSDPAILAVLADLRAKAQVLKTCTGATCWTGQS